MAGDQFPQSGDEFTTLAQRKTQVEELLGGGQPALFQRRRRGLDHRPAHARQDRAPPQRERGPQQVGGLGLAARPQGLGRILGQCVELQEVDLAVSHHHAVSGPVGDDHLGPGRYPPPQVGDGLADLVRRGHRRVVLPGRLHETGDGHHPAGFEEQRAQDPFLDRSPQPQPFFPDPALK